MVDVRKMSFKRFSLNKSQEATTYGRKAHCRTRRLLCFPDSLVLHGRQTVGLCEVTCPSHVLDGVPHDDTVSSLSSLTLVVTHGKRCNEVFLYIISAEGH